MGVDDALQRRAQPGTGSPPLVIYPPLERDVEEGWRVDSSPGAYVEPPLEILPWVTQTTEEVPF